MKTALAQLFIKALNKDALKDIIVPILWELAKLTDNELDDAIVQGVAKALHVKLDN